MVLYIHCTINFIANYFIVVWFSTLCILMDFSILNIDTISMGLSILHFLGSQAEFSKLCSIFVLEF